MTVIVAARTRKRRGAIHECITIACDTQITDGWEKTTGAYPKIWADGERFLFGAAGLVASWQSVKYGVEWPYYPAEQDWEEWLIQEVRQPVVDALEEGGTLYRRRGVLDTNMSLIIASGTNLTSMDSVGGFVVPRNNCVAIGSGYAQALGSLGNKDWWTAEDVIQAAYAATQTDLGCGAPIYYADTLDYEVHEVTASELS